MLFLIKKKIQLQLKQKLKQFLFMYYDNNLLLITYLFVFYVSSFLISRLQGGL